MQNLDQKKKKMKSVKWVDCSGVGASRKGDGERGGYRGQGEYGHFIHMYENRIMKPIKIVSKVGIRE
jgi:hypothetical protein